MPAGRHAIDWRPVVRDVVWIPAAHRVPSVSAMTAMRILRCTPESFAQLVDLGLPATEGPDGPLFDANDVRNAALYSRSGVTEVEIAMRSIFGYMRSGPEALVGDLGWDFSLQVQPIEGPETEPVWVHRPAPEDFGGDLETIAAELADDQVRLPVASPVGGRLRTAGVAATVRSRTVESIARDVLDSGLRWHHIPPSLEAAPAEATALGIGTCVTFSAVLEDQLRAAGYEVRTLRGWCIGALAPHDWVEVWDDDGQIKRIDPALALLATKNGLGTPEFADFVVGSALNRVVPTRCPGRRPLVANAPAGARYDVLLTCRAARSSGVLTAAV